MVKLLSAFRGCAAAEVRQRTEQARRKRQEEDARFERERRAKIQKAAEDAQEHAPSWYARLKEEIDRAAAYGKNQLVYEVRWPLDYPDAIEPHIIAPLKALLRQDGFSVRIRRCEKRHSWESGRSLVITW